MIIGTPIYRLRTNHSHYSSYHSARGRRYNAMQYGQGAEQLSDHMRGIIQGLQGLHSGMATLKRSIASKSDARPIDPSEIKPPRAHPIVRSPAGTNQKAIFVNPHFTIGIKDLDTVESDWILEQLYKVATQPENIYRHQWSPGDVLVWDNRRTMHYAVRDYTEDMPRKLHRCTASGEIPC